VRVAGIWQVGDALVMVRRGTGSADGRWSLPGAAVRAGETLAEAVVRALLDDTAADALCGPFVGWSEQIGDGPQSLTMYFDVVVLDPPEIDGPSGAMPAGPDVAEVRCMPVWDITEVPLEDGLAEFLADQQLIELVI
jgi:ADP-ribose pyrophosphatase YjhB (NUDIX family)